MLKKGLYEQIIDQKLGEALEASISEYIADTEKIDKEEASLILAQDKQADIFFITLNKSDKDT